MKRFTKHVRVQLMRGVIAAIPLALSVLAVAMLYRTIDRRIAPPVEDLLGYHIPGLGIILMLIALYMLGSIASSVMGRQALNLIERVMRRLPIVRTTYQVGKQLSAVLSLPERQVFKRAVLVEYLSPGMWTLGFVTGSLTPANTQAEALLKVFIPTPPNPTSGTLVLVPESRAYDPGWTVEEALHAVISAGMIGPNVLRFPPIAGTKGSDPMPTPDDST